MCLKVRVGAMGCGKSRHRSREESDADTKNKAESNNSGIGSSSKKDGWTNGKRKKSSGSDVSKSPSHRDGEKGGGASHKSSPAKRLTNGARSRLERSQEVGVPLNLSANREAGNDCDPNNGANVTSGKPYTLEVPNEITKQENKTRVTCKDFKSMTASKTVHITSSQIEFFKMLDEKIEKGGDCLTSGDVSEVSSIDETLRQ